MNPEDAVSADVAQYVPFLKTIRPDTFAHILRHNLGFATIPENA
jgi:hypothetical protein